MRCPIRRIAFLDGVSHIWRVAFYMPWCSHKYQYTYIYIYIACRICIHIYIYITYRVACYMPRRIHICIYSVSHSYIYTHLSCRIHIYIYGVSHSYIYIYMACRIHIYIYIYIWHVVIICRVALRGGGLGSRPQKMYGERLGDGVEYHLMKPTPRN